MKLVVCKPSETIPEAYFDARFKILRKPLGSPKGSERLAKDEESINIWIEVNEQIVSVGRVHLLESKEDGKVFDAEAKSKCPAFSPLSNENTIILDDNHKEIKAPLRPAVQIRAMGTLSEYRGQRFASKILTACEKESTSAWNATTGWLQARTEAIPFYQQNGWVCFGPEYQIPNVGSHRSMWKKL